LSRNAKLPSDKPIISSIISEKKSDIALPRVALTDIEKLVESAAKISQNPLN